MASGTHAVRGRCVREHHGLSDPIGSERLNEGRASQRKLASLSFDAAGFGRGKPIARGASSHFRNKYGKNPEDLPQQRSAA